MGAAPICAHCVFVQDEIAALRISMQVEPPNNRLYQFEGVAKMLPPAGPAGAGSASSAGATQDFSITNDNVRDARFIHQRPLSLTFPLCAAYAMAHAWTLRH